MLGVGSASSCLATLAKAVTTALPSTALATYKRISLQLSDTVFYDDHRALLATSTTSS